MTVIQLSHSSPWPQSRGLIGLLLSGNNFIADAMSFDVSRASTFEFQSKADVLKKYVPLSLDYPLDSLLPLIPSLVSWDGLCN